MTRGAVARVTVRGTTSAARRAAARPGPSAPAHAAGRRVQRAGRRRDGARHGPPPAAAAGSRWNSRQPGREQRRRRPRRVAVAAVLDEPQPERLLGVGPIVRPPTGGWGSRGSSARLLMRMSCDATVMKALMCGSWSSSMAAMASRYEPASSPRGTDRMSSWRCSMSDSSSASGPSNSPRLDVRGPLGTRVVGDPDAVAPRTRRGSARGTPLRVAVALGRADGSVEVTRSGCLVREPEPLPRDRVAGRRLVTDELRRRERGQPAARASSAESAGWVRIRSSAVPKPGIGRHDAPDPRAVALAERPGHPMPEPGVGTLGGVVEQAGEQQLGRRRARRRGAPRRHRGHGAGRRGASGRTATAAPG